MQALFELQKVLARVSEYLVVISEGISLFKLFFTFIFAFFLF